MSFGHIAIYYWLWPEQDGDLCFSLGFWEQPNSVTVVDFFSAIFFGYQELPGRRLSKAVALTLCCVAESPGDFKTQLKRPLRFWFNRSHCTSYNPPLLEKALSRWSDIQQRLNNYWTRTHQWALYLPLNCHFPRNWNVQRLQEKKGIWGFSQYVSMSFMNLLFMLL